MDWIIEFVSTDSQLTQPSYILIWDLEALRADKIISSFESPSSIPILSILHLCNMSNLVMLTSCNIKDKTSFTVFEIVVHLKSLTNYLLF